MLELSLKATSGDMSAFKKIVSSGISEELKKIEYALEKTRKIIKKYEEEYKMSSEEFLKDFHEGSIEESSDFFEWWAEMKLISDLEEKLHLVKSIEICRSVYDS